MTKAERKRLTHTALLGSASFALMLSAAHADETVAFDIKSGSLVSALNDYARQSDQEILFSTDIVAGKETKALNGVYAPQEALERILFDTGLVFDIDEGDTILIKDPAREAAAPRPFRVAQLDQATVAAPEANKRGAAEIDEEKRDEIIVTGTNIRGVQNIASPLTVITREDIDRQGFATTQQLLRSLPQNLDAGESSVVTASSVSNNAEVGTVGINARGLGVGTTLTLVNGRRIAAGAGSRQQTDVSLIPLSAVERVEVLTDGASAIYGTDAIAGVVNFILRDDFEGAETRLRFGGVTEGSSQEYQASQTVGAAWSGGNILANYEHYRRNDLDTRSKPFTEDAPAPSDILPETVRHSVYLTGRQDLSSRASVFADAFYSTRDTDFVVTTISSVLGSNTVRRLARAEQYGATLGSNVELAADWRLEIAGSFNSSQSDNDTSTLTSGATNTFQSTFDLWTADAKADGSLFSLPAGDVKLAVGGQYRNESFDSETLNLNLGRDIYAVFSEIYAPVIGEDNRRPGVFALDFTAAARFEDYSDFGSSLDPKIGLRYAPFEGLNFRGTYGTSFRAPNFFELNGDGVSVAFPGAFLAPPAGAASAPNVLALDGPNPGLEPEQSRTWTAGFDFTPATAPGLTVKGTYFNINYDERIATPLTTGLSTLFPNQSVLGPLLAFPDTAGFDALVSANFPTSPLFNPFGLTAADIGAVFDGRLQNVASTKVTGVDFSIDYTTRTEVGDVNVGVNGSYLFDFLQRNLPDAPEIDTRNLQGNPVDLRMRGTVGWSQDNLSASLFINYVDNYQSNATGVIQSVDSWTTVDVNAAYALGQEQSFGFLSDARFSLNITNLFNEAPPFVDRTSLVSDTGQNYDGANANALGRVVSLQIEKAF